MTLILFHDDGGGDDGAGADEKMYQCPSSVTLILFNDDDGDDADDATKGIESQVCHTYTLSW